MGYIMSFFSEIIAKLKYPLFGPFTTEWERMPRQGKTRPGTDPKALVERNRNWVYVCAHKNAAACAAVPLRLYAKGGNKSRYEQRAVSREKKAYLASVLKTDSTDMTEIVAGHPLVDLMDRINPHMTRGRFIEATVLWVQLTGDAYWHVERDPLGVPVSLWPLPAQYVKIIPDPKNLIAGYWFGRNSQEGFPFAFDEVIHVNEFNPADLWYGKSRVEAIVKAPDILNSQQDYELDLYDNGGLPQVGLMYKQALNEEQRKRVYSEWREKFASRRKGDKAIILAGGDDIKTFGFPPKEVGLEESQKFSLKLITAAFDIPMTIIEMSESNLASAQAGAYQWMEFGIKPMLCNMAEILTEQLAQRYYDERLYFAFDDPTPADKAYRLQEIQTRLNTRMTSINEERAIDGLDPVAWGEKPEERINPMDIARGGGDTRDEEEEDNGKAWKTKGVRPLTKSEIAFSDMLEEHFVSMAREVDGKLREAE